MSGTLIWTDRLRIERAVWTFNSYLQALPWRSQVAKRRELRVNLRAASADVGTKEALRRLGNVRTMAADYITAEYGGPRPSWWAAICVLQAFWFMFWLSSARIDAFKGGVIAANPHATGLFHWHGVAYVFTAATFTFVNGKATEVVARCCRSSTCASLGWRSLSDGSGVCSRHRAASSRLTRTASSNPYNRTVDSSAAIKIAVDPPNIGRLVHTPKSAWAGNYRENGHGRPPHPLIPESLIGSLPLRQVGKPLRDTRASVTFPAQAAQHPVTKEQAVTRRFYFARAPRSSPGRTKDRRSRPEHDRSPRDRGRVAPPQGSRRRAGAVGPPNPRSAGRALASTRSASLLHRLRQRNVASPRSPRCPAASVARGLDRSGGAQAR